MALLDDFQNFNANSDDGSLAVDPDESRRKRSELERQIVILNSDLKKYQREIEYLEEKKRKFKKEEQRIRIERDELDKKLKTLDNDRMSLEEEIGRLKKKLKVLVP